MVVEWTYNEETCTPEGAKGCRRKSLQVLVVTDVTIFIPSHTLFWTILWTLSYRNNDLLISWSYILIISLDHISSDRWSYLTDDLMFLYISSTCARRILWILLTCFRHVLHMAYACHSFPMLCTSCSQHVLLMTYACSPYCLHAYFTI